MATDRIFLMARPWLRLDPRRPQFAWFPLAANPIGSASVTFWLIIPVLVCAIASASTVQVKGDTTGIALSFAGVVTVLVPRSIYGYLELIQSRTDHRGGRATYSMVLLYWYRVLRQILYTAFFIIPVLAVVPKWRLTMLNWSGVLIAAILVGLGFRFVGGLSFIYRRIDQIGVRYGFPAKSEHY